MYREAQDFFRGETDKLADIQRKLADYTARVAEAEDDGEREKYQKFITQYQKQEAKIQTALGEATTQFEKFKTEQEMKQQQRKADQAKEAKEGEYQELKNKLD